MKKTIILLLLVSNNLHAANFVTPLLHGYDGPQGGIINACAPEVAENNLDITEKALSKLAMSEEFKNQDTFKEIVKDISKTQSSDKKMEKYFSLVDVKTPEEVVAFIGARKSQYKQYSAILSKNTELPTELSFKVIETLTTSLKSN